MDTESLPIACNLTDSELQERRRTTLQKVRSGVVGVKELEDGYAYCFRSTEEWLAELSNLVNLERQCCPFMRFRIVVEPNDGPTWLELTGPEGTKDFLALMFN